MSAMKNASRNDISGFTLAGFGYTLEIVTVRNWPVCLAISRGAITIYRLELE